MSPLIAGSDEHRIEICMYTPTTQGGHALYTMDLLSALATTRPDQELEVSLFTCSELPARYRTDRYKIHDPLPPVRSVHDFPGSAIWSLYRQAYYFRRDRMFLQWAANSTSCCAVHFQEYTPWLSSAHFGKLKQAGLRLFFTVHGVYPNKYMSGVPKALFHKWCRDGWKQCDVLFVHTEGLRRALRRFLDSEHPPICVTPSGITEMLGDLPTHLASVQPANPRRLLFFGVARPTKGLHILLQAMRELPEHRLTIAGDFKEASYKKRILDQIAALPKEQIRLIDRFVDDDEIPELFGRSSLVIMPYTFFHAHSGVLRLALKYGVPMVASDVGSFSESVRGWGVGECVPPNDAGTLAEAIRRMEEPERHRAARAAIEKKGKELTWEKTAELTWQAYRSVLGA